MTNEEIVRELQEKELSFERKQALELELYSQNKKILYHWARKYADFIECDDYLQESFLCLHEAVVSFDLNYEGHFSSWWKWCIRNAIRKYEKNSGVSRSDSILNISKKIKKITDEREKNGQGSPTLEELSRLLGVSVERIQLAMLQEKSVLSLDKVYEDEDGGTLGDSIVDSSPGIEDAYIRSETRKEISQAIRKAVDSMPNEKQKKAIVDYYFNNKSVQDIAQSENLSQNTIHANKKAGLRFLKRDNELMKLAQLEGLLFTSSGLGSFIRSGNSSVERYVLLKLEMEKERKQNAVAIEK